MFKWLTIVLFIVSFGMFIYGTAQIKKENDSKEVLTSKTDSKKTSISDLVKKHWEANKPFNEGGLILFYR